MEKHWLQNTVLSQMWCHDCNIILQRLLYIKEYTVCPRLFPCITSQVICIIEQWEARLSRLDKRLPPPTHTKNLAPAKIPHPKGSQLRISTPAVFWVLLVLGKGGTVSLQHKEGSEALWLIKHGQLDSPQEEWGNRGRRTCLMKLGALKPEAGALVELNTVSFLPFASNLFITHIHAGSMNTQVLVKT